MWRLCTTLTREIAINAKMKRKGNEFNACQSLFFLLQYNYLKFMPDYIERYNVIVSRETAFDADNLVIGSTYKETIMPLNWLMVVLVLGFFLVIIKKLIWPN